MRDGKHYSDKKKRRLASLIIVFIILLTVVLVSFITITTRYKEIEEKHIADTKSLNFNKIESYIKQLELEASKSAKDAADSIKVAIGNEYPGEKLNQLKAEFQDNDYSSLSKVITRVVQDRRLNSVDNYNNSIMVATDNIILCDLCYSTATESNDIDYSTWELFVNKNYNKKLAAEAAESIVQVPTGMIIIEPTESSNKNHVYHESVDIETLRQVYIAEGLEGLRNYQILVPSYIQDINTDIFGSPKLDHGIIHQTHRLAVIQRCNIYDQIYENNYSLTITQVDEIIKDKNKILNNLYIIGCFIAITFIAALIVICFIFNQYILSDDEKESNTSE